MVRKRKIIVIWLSISSKKKLMLATMLLVSLLAVFTYEIPSLNSWSYWTLPLSGKMIAIDAGHGGPDGGASSSEGVVEKDINLAICLYLRDYLQQAGALVILTRETDTDLAKEGTKGLSRRKTEDLHNRVALIKSKKADLLISIHLNSIPSPRWYGAQTFYYPNREESMQVATLIQDELKKNLLNTERVAKSISTPYLLKQMTIPSALVEVGFLSHREEAKLLADENYQKKVAAAIYRGLLRYSSGEKIGTL